MTLKKYNPTVDDRTLKIYLLKSGWQIEEIEKTFADLSRLTPTMPSMPQTPPVPVAAPVATVPTSAVAPVAASIQSQPQPQSQMQPQAPARRSAAEIMMGTFTQNATPVASPVPTSIPTPIPTSIPKSPSQMPSSAQMPKVRLAQAIPHKPRSIEVAAPELSASSAKSQAINRLQFQAGILGSQQPSQKPSQQMPQQQQQRPQTQPPRPQSGQAFTQQPSVSAVSVPATTPMQSAPMQKKVDPIVPRPTVAATFPTPMPNPVQQPIQRPPQQSVQPPAQLDNPQVINQQGPQPKPNIKDVSRSEVPGEINHPRREGVLGSVPSSADILNATFSQNTASAPAPAPIMPMPVAPAIPDATQTPPLSGQGSAVSSAYVLKAQFAQTAPGSPVAQSAAQPTSALGSIPVIIKPKKKHRGLFMAFLIIILLVLGAIGFGYFRYVHGVYTFVAAPIAKEDIVRHINQSLSKINTARYDAEVHLSFVKPAESTKSLDSSVLSSVVADIPLNTLVNLNIEGAYQKNSSNDESSSDGIWNIAGDYTEAGVKLGFDIESLRSKRMSFIKFNDFPAMLLDIENIREKWISVEKKDIDMVGSLIQPLALFFNKDSVAGNIGLEQQMMRVLSASGTSPLKVIGEPELLLSKTGQNWYEPKMPIYQYKLQPTEEFAKQNNIFGYGEYILTVDKDGKLVSLSYGSRFALNAPGQDAAVSGDGSASSTPQAPPTSAVAAKQVNFDIILVFKDINQSIDSVSPPIADMNLTDAYLKTTGQSMEFLSLNMQVQNVSGIRSAIASYMADHNGEVPDELNQLTGLDSKALIDNATNQSFIYKKKTKTTYTLEYTIAMPTLPKTYHDLAYNLMAYDTPAAGSAAVGDAKPMLYLKYVNGKNTASEKSISLETDINKKLDSDKDRIANTLEIYIGTNLSKADSDDDGTDDYEELRKGGNPKGPGGWNGVMSDG